MGGIFSLATNAFTKRMHGGKPCFFTKTKTVLSEGVMVEWFNPHKYAIEWWMVVTTFESKVMVRESFTIIQSAETAFLSVH